MVIEYDQVLDLCMFFPVMGLRAGLSKFGNHFLWTF